MSPTSLPAFSDLSSSQAQLVQNACTQYESAWRAWSQGPPRIESFLDGVKDPVRTVLLAELLRRELDSRYRQGETPKLEEYRRRFPGQDWLAPNSPPAQEFVQAQ